MKKNQTSQKNNFSSYFSKILIKASPSKVNPSFQEGFTMIEMLVVLAIFTVMTLVVMFNYGRFNSQTIMTNMAYEVALTTRQAQVYSLGVRGGGDESLTDFSKHYGISVNLANNKNFIFFLDENNNNSCEDLAGASCGGCLAGGECLNKYTLTHDIYIDKICVSTSNDPVDSIGICNGYSVQDLAITFKRPNPDGVFSSVDYSGDNADIKSAAIVLKTKFGNQRAVMVQNTGQISVEFLTDI